MADMVRKHITVPREVAEAFEKLVGERNQSAEIVALMEGRLKREARAGFFRENAGFVSAADQPEWATSADIVEWVRNLRENEWENPATKAAWSSPPAS